MATMQDAIDEIQALVRALPGIRKAADEPPEKLTVFPYAVAYLREGTFTIGPPELMTGLHTIVVELHVARKDLPRATQTAMQYAKSIPKAICAGLKDGTLTALETFEQIRYQYGLLDYGDTQTLGFRFLVEGVKTQDAVT